MRNFWTIKQKEAILLKIVKWARTNGKKVSELSSSDIKEFLNVSHK